jgi:hypothetical protein
MAGFILLIVLLVAWRQFTGAAPGYMVFAMVSWLQFVTITLLGWSWFASPIAEEKEDGTIGLLRMTNLDPLSILLGKSTSRLFGVLLLLLAQFPFTLLAVTLGGISQRQIVASYCILGAYTFLVSNLALLCSVVMPNVARATVAAVAGVVIYFLAGPVLAAIHTSFVDLGLLTPSSWAERALDALASSAKELAVTERFDAILQPGFSAYLGPAVTWHVWAHAALGVVCFLAAWALFPRFVDRTVAKAAGPARRVLGIPVRRPPRPWWKRELAWKEFYFVGGGKPAVWLRLVGYGGWAVWIILLKLFESSSTTVIHTLGGSVISIAMTIELAVVASRLFRLELRDQTWSSLALLPTTLRQVTRQKLRGALRPRLPCIAVYVLSELLAPESFFSSGDGQFLIAGVALVANAAGVIFVGYLVAFLSLRMNRGALAVGLVVAVVTNSLLQFIVVLIVFAGGFWTSSGSVIQAGIVSLATAVIYVAACRFLHRSIFRRVEQMAGEE